MEEDIKNNLSFILKIAVPHKDYLVGIRHWKNLKAASSENCYWVTGFSEEQINSKEVKSIPHALTFRLQDKQLFFIGSNLPERKCPSLLWTPINLAFPLKLPKQNHNYFGLTEKTTLKIKTSADYKSSFAIITFVDRLMDYMRKSSAVRYQNLQWTILNSETKEVLILGQPLLPINGKTYWKYSGNFTDFLIPSGYDLNLPSAMSILENKYFVSFDNLILWNKDSEYTKIPKSNFENLSLSSLRLTQDELFMGAV